MNIPNWPFALLRVGVVALIYLKIAPHYASLYAQPLLYYGIPFLLVPAILGVHRYVMMALGTLLLCGYAAGFFPPAVKMDNVPALALAMLTFFVGFTPCDRDFSVRAFWHSGEKDFFKFKADPRNLWILYCGLVCAFYVAHLIKRTNPNFLQGNYVGRALIEQFWGADFIFASWFPAFCSVLAVILWSLNLSFCVLVWQPRFYKQFLVMATAFHAFFLFLVPGRDMAHFIFLLLLFPFAGLSLSLAKPSKVLTTT